MKHLKNISLLEANQEFSPTLNRRIQQAINLLVDDVLDYDTIAYIKETLMLVQEKMIK
jgi:hypothetical protein